jgi:hypothetical protein
MPNCLSWQPVSGRLAAAALASLALCGSAFACPANLSATYPRTAAALTDWETSRRVKLVPTAQQAVVSSFCAAASRLQSQLGVAAGELDAGSRSALWQYLDQGLTSAPTVTSMESLLSEPYRLGASPRLPEPRALGVINVAYQRRVDRLRVGELTLEPWPRLLATIGTVSIAGIADRQVVCQGNVTVTVARAADFAC